jgi:hypothetical protein
MSWFPWNRGSFKKEIEDTCVEEEPAQEEEQQEEKGEKTNPRCLSIFQQELQAYHSRR